MAIWKNSFMDTLGYDGSIDLGKKCEVKIDDESISVSYTYEEEEPTYYKGGNDGSDHFQLDKNDQRGEASLHRFKNGLILEGYWEENGGKGFWRIKLNK